MLEQILSNALKYTKEGSISIYMEGDELAIRDTGIGISPEDLPRVFEKGFTGYNGRRDKTSTAMNSLILTLDVFASPCWTGWDIRSGSSRRWDGGRKSCLIWSGRSFARNRNRTVL